MATVKFRLRNNTTEMSTISIHLSIGRGKQFLCSTGLSISPKEWKTDNKSLIGYPKNIINPIITNLKNDLSRLETFLLIEVNGANSNGDIIDSNWVKDKVNKCFNRATERELKELTDVIDANKLLTQLEGYINGANTYIQSNGKIGLSIHRIKSLKLLRSVLISYQKESNTEIYLKDIDFELITKLNKWMLEVKKFSVNYGGAIMRDIKATCRHASKKNIEVNSYVPFIKSYNQQRANKIIQTLSIKEVNTIENLEIKSKSLNNARKWIVFGCNIGQRGSDLLNITLNNFVTIKGQKYIELRQGKTSKDVLIPITEQCKRILLEGMPYKINQVALNQSIKKVCELAEINQEINGDLYDKKVKRKVRGVYPKYKLITIHCFRRSYATNYYIDIPTPIIMEITGHSKESTFLEYVNKPIDKSINANLMLEMIERKAKENESDTLPQIKYLKPLN